MNNSPYNPEQHAEYIPNFSNLTPQELEAVRTTHGLTASLPLLTLLQRYYRITERRYPSVEELKFLCEYFTALTKRPSSVCVAALRSVDAEAGRIFDDLTAKLTAAGKKAPFDLLTIFKAADEYLRLVGSPLPVPLIYGKCGSSARLEFAAKGATVSAELGFSGNDSTTCIVGFPSCPPFSRLDADEADTFSLLTVTDRFEGDFCSVVYDLLHRPGILHSIKRAEPVGSGGLFGFMLGSSKGFYADITRLPAFAEKHTPLILLEEMPDSVMLVIGGGGLAALSAAAAECGLAFTAFARPTATERISIRYGMGAPLSFDASFVKSTSFADAACVVDINSADAALQAAPPMCVGRGKSTVCDYPLTCAQGSVLSAAVSSSATLRDAALTVISAVTPLAAAGVPYKNVGISFDASLALHELDGETLGKALSMLLGLYRSQTELALRSEGSICTAGPENRLAVYTRAEPAANIMPNTLDDCRGYLCLLSPRAGENGLPDFAELRILMRHIVSLTADGRASAIRAVGRDGGHAALEGMCRTDCLNFEENAAIALNRAGVGSFIIACPEPVGGFVLGKFADVN